jgi:hypothetical protein
MSRSIVTAPSGSSPVRRNSFPDLVDKPVPEGSPFAPQEKLDTYRDRLFKYIPAEVVTLYLGLSAIVASATDAPRFLYWVIFGAGVIGTPYYLRFVQKVTAPMQLIISTLAFGVWVFALGGPFKDIQGYKQIYGAVLLPLFTFFVAGLSPGQPEQSRQQDPGKGSAGDAQDSTNPGSRPRMADDIKGKSG